MNKFYNLDDHLLKSGSMNRLFISISILLTIGLCQAQDSVKVSSEPLKIATVQSDSLIDGQTYLETLNLDAITEDSTRLLKDHELAAHYDSKWLLEFYNNNLFDSIYKSVSEIDYKDVDLPELSTDTLKKRLSILNAKTPLNVEYNPDLERVIKSFLKYRRKSLEKLMGLSHFYFPMFEQEFDRFNIPLEMKYLAIVESALKPRARYRVGASGLWQFMYGTGKQFDLKVSSYDL